MIQIEIDGLRYDGFTNASIKRSMDTMCASYSLTCTAKTGKAFPIQRSKPVKIIVEGEVVLTGYVENLKVDYSATRHNIIISGRGRTCDLIDSSLTGVKEFNAPISLEAIINKVLLDNGLSEIQVINQAGALDMFRADEIVAAEVGQTVFEFIEKFARKRQVFLGEDGNGNLLLLRAGVEDSGTALLNLINGSSNNIISASVSYNETNRFNRYTVHSQLNTKGLNKKVNGKKTSAKYNAEQLTAQTGSAYDSEIRTTRVKEIVADTSSSSQDSTQQAIWNANVARARSSEFNCSVQGFKKSPNTIWKVNQLVKVEDHFCDVNAILLINTVEYSLSVESGSTTAITCVVKDAYTLQSELDAQEKKANVQGDGNKAPLVWKDF